MLISLFEKSRRRIAEARCSEKDPISGPTAGTSFIEIFIAVAMFSAGMVSIMGSVITVTMHRHVADERALASQLAGSAFENIRGLSIDNLLVYDVPVDNTQNGTINLSVWPGDIEPVRGDPGDVDTLFQLGVDDVASVNVDSLPNPIEIKAVMTPYSTNGYAQSNMQFTAATMIDY